MIKDIPRLLARTVLGNFLDIQPCLTSYNIIIQLEQTKSIWQTCGRVIWELNTFAASSASSCPDDRLTEVSTLPPDTICPVLSRIRILTSKITQVCQDIRDIKLRRLLVTHSDEEPNDITNRIQTNRNDRKNTRGSSRSTLDLLDTREDHAEGGTDYVYKTPNHLEHDTQNNPKDHEKCPPQLQPIPSGMTPEPPPCPDPSEASERSSSPPASLSSPLKKDDNGLVASSMYTERPDLSWNLDLVPAKKYGGVEPAEELEMREGTGLMKEEASPC